MRRSDARSSAFTLIETLIVVAIVCIASPIVFQSITRASDMQKMRHFMEELDTVIGETQMKAVSASSYMTIVFNTDRDFYQVTRGVETETRPLDPRLTVFSNAGTTSIEIDRDGQFHRIGTYTFRLNQIKYRLVLLLGQGRYHIEKSDW